VGHGARPDDRGRDAGVGEHEGHGQVSAGSRRPGQAG
jgi:hypothetical protein